MPSSPGTFFSSSEHIAPPAAPAPAVTPARSADSRPGGHAYVWLTPGQERTRRIFRNVLFLVSGIAAVVCTYLYVEHTRVYPSTDNAYVQADIVRLASRVSGPILRLLVVDNQRVKQGDLLLEIDPKDFEMTLEMNKSELAAAEAQVAQAQSAIGQAEAQLAQTNAQIQEAQAPAERSHRDQRRAESLDRNKVISKQEMDAANSTADTASATLTASRSSARNATAALVGAHASYETAVAQRGKAATAVQNAELQLSYTRIYAPVDGLITNLNLPPGNYLTTGQSPLTLVAARTWRVLAYYKETYTAQMRPGQRVRVHLFPYPDHEFEGVVQGVAWGIYQSDGSSTAATAQLPNVSPTINWVRLAQRFPVRINLPQEDSQRPFRIGQTAVVQVDTTSRRDQPVVSAAVP